MSSVVHAATAAAAATSCWIVATMRTSLSNGNYLSNISVFENEESANEERKSILLRWLYDYVKDYAEGDGLEQPELWTEIENGGWRLRNEQDLVKMLDVYNKGHRIVARVYNRCIGRSETNATHGSLETSLEDNSIPTPTQMSSAAIHETNPLAAAAADISPNVPKDVCDWFRSFYTTNAMIRSGCAVHTPIDGHRGELYDYAARKAAYQAGLHDYFNNIREIKEKSVDGNVNESDLDDVPETEPLTAAAHSLFTGPLDSFERMEQPSKFDNDTLRRIIDCFGPANNIHYSRGDSDTDTAHRAALLLAVVKIIEEEYETCDIEIENHPVTELMSGVLCLDNGKLLSDSDLRKMAYAHGVGPTLYRDHFIRGILESQVGLFQEMVDKSYTTETRAYCRIRGFLVDNKETLGLTVDQDLEAPACTQYNVDARHKRKVLDMYTNTAAGTPSETDAPEGDAKRRKNLASE